MSDFLNDLPRGAAESPVAAKAQASVSADAPWEQSVLEKMAMSLVRERRTARRWGIFFKLVALAYIVGITLYLTGWLSGAGVGGDENRQHTALVSISGVIKANSENSAESVNKSLRAAFKDKNTAGVVLRINSPGGSPVQSGLIYREIRNLREKYPDIRLIAVVEEVCASGGYYVAAAADEIHVDQASLVGSIGVLIDSFGFAGAMQRLGIERRLFTAGTNKGFLDSFSPVSPAQRDHVQQMLGDIHQQFIDSVKAGRGERLKPNKDLFTGLIWTGAQSVQLGLADKIGSVRQVARDEFEAETMVNFSQRKSLAERFAQRVGMQVGKALGDGVEGVFQSVELR